MATGNRPARVAALIKEELAALLARGELKDPRIKMASISEVKLANDLRSGKVYVQVIGTPEERASTVKGMQNAHGFIRKQLRDRLSLRVAPELIFVADEAAERADKVLGILAGLAKERDAAAAAAAPVAVDSEADEEEEESEDE